MIPVISPAKNLNFEPASSDYALTTPQFQAEANALAARAQTLSVAEIKALMELSDALAELNHARFQAFEPEPRVDLVKQAALAFAGDTYQGLRFSELSGEAVDRAQARLCILSGLYGVLRPLDAIQPYRLEMGRKLRTDRGRTLYDWWGAQPAEAIGARVAETGAEAVVNLASVEYFSAVDAVTLPVPVISPVFLEEKDGLRRIISFHAKKARGAMARWMLEADVRTVEGLRGFAEDGYAFDAAESTVERPVFVRVA